MRTYIANKKYLVSSDADLKNVKLLIVPEGRQVILIKINDKKAERFFPILEKHKPLKVGMSHWKKFSKGIGLKSDDLQYFTQGSGSYVIDESQLVYMYNIIKGKISITPVADFCHTLSIIDGKGKFKDIVVEELGYLQTTKDYTRTDKVEKKKKVIKIEQKISRQKSSVIKIFKEGEPAIVEFPEDIKLKYDYTPGDIDANADNYEKMLK